MTTPTETELPPAEAADGSTPSEPRSTDRRPGHVKRRTSYWMRFLHVYTSMFALVVMIFFGITGITLNHPSWTFGDETVTSTDAGTLPDDVLGDGDVELLAVSEFVRSSYDVGAEVSDFSITGNEGQISYKGPGYGADVFFQADTGEYSITIQEQGFVGVMNDLHKGRDSSTTWRWIIDASGALLVVIGVTGLGIQLLMRKRRTSALAWTVVGGVLTVVLIWVTMV